MHNDKPRVLLLVNQLGGGGAERDVAMLCQYADQSRFQLEVWTLLGGGDLEPIVHQAGIPVHCLNRKHAYSPVFALRAAREIARARFDLIHVFLPAIALNAALAKVLWRAKSPLIYSELSAQPKSRLKDTLRRWSLRQCSTWIANAPASRAYLERSGIEQSRITIVPNGHEVARYRTMSCERSQLRASLGVGPEQTLAIYVGRLIPSKRVCDLVDALAMLHGQHPELRLVLAGEGPERARLQQQIDTLALGRAVRLVGRRLDIPDLLQASDLFVFPSESEGLSNSVIEAALSGLPIVACDIAGVREIVLGGRGAELVPCRDPAALAAAIQRVVENPEEAKARARLSQQYAQNEYAIERVLQRLYNLYDEVLHANACRSH
jgi:glycosyltransferase involved in cell wall biosynthesis